MTYKLEKIELPFEGKKWVLYASDHRSSPFGTYNTKKEAMKDVKEFGLKLES